MSEALPLALAVGVIALLYSTLGQAGASGYLAVLSLAGLAPAEVRPLALLLNVLVGAIASVQFWRSGHFSWSLFWPFALFAVPLAFIGGRVELPGRAFEIVVGAILCAAALRLLVRPEPTGEAAPPQRAVALAMGAALGLLAGLTGTGGGIFLAPLLLLRRWARAQQAAAVTALFVLVNSLAGLAGSLAARPTLPAFAAPLAVAAAAGGLAGSWLGARRLPRAWIERGLAGVLLIAALRLLLGR